MDNMNTMDFNQKIDVSLRASLEATPVERNASDDLSTGSSSDGFWDLIVLYTGSPQTLQNEFPSSSFTFLLGNYAIVKISEDDIPSLAAFPSHIYRMSKTACIGDCFCPAGFLSECHSGK